MALGITPNSPTTRSIAGSTAAMAPPTISPDFSAMNTLSSGSAPGSSSRARKCDRSSSAFTSDMPVTAARVAKTASKSPQLKFRISAASLKKAPVTLAKYGQNRLLTIIKRSRQDTTGRVSQGDNTQAKTMRGYCISPFKSLSAVVRFRVLTLTSPKGRCVQLARQVRITKFVDGTYSLPIELTSTRFDGE